MRPRAISVKPTRHGANHLCVPLDGTVEEDIRVLYTMPGLCEKLSWEPLGRVTLLVESGG